MEYDVEDDCHSDEGNFVEKLLNNPFQALSLLSENGEPSTKNSKAAKPSAKKKNNTTKQVKHQTAGVGNAAQKKPGAAQKSCIALQLATLSPDERKIAEECLKSLTEEEQGKKSLFKGVVPIKVDTNPVGHAKLRRDIDTWRDKAYAEKRNRIFNMDQMMNHCCRNLSSAAEFFRIAQDRSNDWYYAWSKVKNIILHNTSPYYLDLHYVTVPMAIEILDIFLNWHVRQRMRDQRVPDHTVEIITGWGQRSENGKAKLKPAVMGRLADRGVRYEENALNMGALQVFITRQMKFHKLPALERDEF